MKYVEGYMEAAPWRTAYRDGLEALVEARYAQARRERVAAWRDFPANQEEHRRRAIEILGWPLMEARSGLPAVRTVRLAEEESYTVYRATIEALPGVPFYGLLFLLRGEPKRPLVLSLHGKEGTPELCSSLLGSSSNYNEMTQRILAQGVHVFAPQTLLWNQERFGVPYDRGRLDAQLKHLGGSILALEAFCMMRSIDALTALDCVEPAGVGVCGLSYGGLYALLLAALDVRVRSTIACARFADLDFDVERIVRQGDAQIAWKGAAFGLTQVEMAMLCYPRRLCIPMAVGDGIVRYALAERAREELLTRAAATLDEGWFEFIPFEGSHEFSPDDGAIRRMVAGLT